MSQLDIRNFNADETGEFRFLIRLIKQRLTKSITMEQFEALMISGGLGEPMKQTQGIEQINKKAIRTHTG